MFRLATAAMKQSRGEGVSYLAPLGIKLISCTMSSWTCSSLVIDKDSGVGGGYLGYGGKFGIGLECGGRFGIDFVLCKPWVHNEKVDLVFQMIVFIDESVFRCLVKILGDHKLCRSLYLLTISPSEEKAVSDSHVASEIGYPFHLT